MSEPIMFARGPGRSRGRPAAPALLRGRRRGAALRAGGGPAPHLGPAAFTAHPRARARPRLAAVRAHEPEGGTEPGRRAAADRRPRRAPSRRPLRHRGGRARLGADDVDRRLLPRQRGRHDADHPGVSGRAPRRRRPARRSHLAAHPRWPAHGAAGGGHPARPGRRAGPGGVRAPGPGAGRPRRRAPPTIAWPARLSCMRTSSTPSRCWWWSDPTRPRPTTRSSPIARPWGPGLAGSPTPPFRWSGCSTWWRWAPGSAG